ncbi:hybrid sensor histidine kinase/response regulator [Paractinoplanes abujensis]|uniref:histidine kinase n=1 Tax=Paractinoplanes abujensis TaxID=882441 RepID=A0A7W7D305_9ACTN|nr:response regulator [Actinoplanes abujensis]MBB4698028.1 PAS domain S-box-containing protein [Actinoplanes abujensis]
MAYPLRYALADLALALSRVSHDPAAVQSTAARAAADMIGDGAGVQLLRDDGRYDSITYHHIDDERSASMSRVLDHVDQLPDDDFSTALAASRRPLVLAGDGVEPLAGEEHEIHSAVLCPVIVDNTYAGYLVLTRETPGSFYSTAEVELARDIAGELALACSSARALERLRASEERYRRVLETIPEGVLQLDADGVVTYANEPIGVVLGMPRSQLVGVSLRGFLNDQGQKELNRRINECREGRSTVGGTRLMRADGSQRSVRISMMPLMGDHGEFTGVVCMVTDTTDHIDARGLKRQLDHLRRLDSLGQLIGGISHDFNNLLTVVGGSAEMISSSSEQDSQHHRLATDILEAVGTGRSLTHQLLAFGRSDGNRPEIIPIPDLLTDVQSLFSRTLGEHIGLDLAFGPDVWAVRAERGPLEQALVNLAANARDAMLHGGMLRVAAMNEVVEPGKGPEGMPAGKLVHIVITDTGVGMTDEVRQRALEPFFTTRPTAAGLGLATTAGIVQGIGGHIELESEPRMGTTVHLYLPAAEEKPASGTGRQGAPTVIGRVLIVEDQPEVAQLVQRLIEPAGYAITVATDTLQAVSLVAAGQHPDLLITDVVMPTMTGPELANALRTHRPDLPVLYMSGYTAASLGPQLHLDDNSMLIEKPFTRSTLLGAIRTLAGTQPSSAPNDPATAK